MAYGRSSKSYSGRRSTRSRYSNRGSRRRTRSVRRAPRRSNIQTVRLVIEQAAPSVANPTPLSTMAGPPAGKAKF